MRIVTDQPLSLDLHRAEVEDARRGAVALFLGTVRDHDPEIAGEVAELHYSAHPDAQSILSGVVEEFLATHDVSIAVSHRIGTLRVGDAALIAAVAADHRGPAFDVLERLVERIKAEVPIWKHQVNVSGEAVWSGLASGEVGDA